MTEGEHAADEARIRRLKDELTAALRGKDAGGVVSRFADRSIMFVLAPPLRFRTGIDAPGEAGVRQWFDSFDGPLGYEFREFEVACDGTVAFCHSLDRISGRRTDGTDTDLWVRETLGLLKIRGEWKIAHQHQSVPMRMDGSGRAATDLTP